MEGRTWVRAGVRFLIYCAFLLMGLYWAHLRYVEDRIVKEGSWSPAAAYLYIHCLFGVAAVYVALRTYRVHIRQLTDRRSYVWVGCDLLFITALVELTGGVTSDASLLYLWPLVAAAVRHQPRMTLSFGLVTFALFMAAAWPAVTDDIPKWCVRGVVVLIYTAIAVYYAVTEAAQVEEMAGLREEVAEQTALGEYRANLSREMHDGIQHSLVRIAMRLELVRRMLPQDALRAARLAVNEILTARQASDELRYLVRRLRSPALDDRGFASALRDHVSHMERSASFSTSVEIDGQPAPMPQDVEQAALRIVQEALTNAEKYARANRLTIHLTFSPDEFQCRVSDDGVGFDVAELPAEPCLEGGLGVICMRERAESLGGSLRLTSSPGQGTSILVTIPLSPDGEADSVERGEPAAAQLQNRGPHIAGTHPSAE